MKFLEWANTLNALFFEMYLTIKFYAKYQCIFNLKRKKINTRMNVCDTKKITEILRFEIIIKVNKQENF